MKTKKMKIEVNVPEDYELDEQEIDWIDHIIERAANRGSGLEDAECAIWQQRGHGERIVGAKLVIDMILQLAGTKFSEGKDSAAADLRNLAVQLKAKMLPEMEKDRDEHKRLFLDSYHEEVQKRRAGAQA